MFNCKYCNKEFGTSKQISTHTRMCSLNPNKQHLAFNDERSYICKICSKEFSTGSKLGGHMSSHTRAGKKLNNGGKGRGKGITIQCCECGKDVYLKPSYVSNTDLENKCCSVKCSNIHKKRQKKRQKNLLLDQLAWQGGLVNITNKQLDDYIESHKVCELCGKPERIKHQSGKTRRLAVDHNHETNEFRGMLCYSCNIKIGWLENTDIDKVLEYIDRHPKF